MQKSGSKVATAKTVTAKTAVPVKQETVAKPVEKTVEAKQETLVFDTVAPVEKKETEKKTAEKKTAAKKATGKK